MYKNDSQQEDSGNGNPFLLPDDSQDDFRPIDYTGLYQEARKKREKPRRPSLLTEAPKKSSAKQRREQESNLTDEQVVELRRSRKAGKRARSLDFIRKRRLLRYDAEQSAENVLVAELDRLNNVYSWQCSGCRHGRHYDFSAGRVALDHLRAHRQLRVSALLCNDQLKKMHLLAEIADFEREHDLKHAAEWTKHVSSVLIRYGGERNSHLMVCSKFRRVAVMIKSQIKCPTETQL